MRSLETERLIIREAREADLDFVVALMNDGDYLRLIGDRGVRDLESAAAYVASSPIYDYAEGLGFNIVETKIGERVGICGLVRRESDGDVDLGYAMLHRHSGKGYATEAARATLKHAQRELGLERVIAITTAINVGSRRVLERSGFRLESVADPDHDGTQVCIYVASGQR